MFKKVYSLYSASCTQPAFYSQSAVCILHSVCILPLVRSLQSALRSLRFTLTDKNHLTATDFYRLTTPGSLQKLPVSYSLRENSPFGVIGELALRLGTIQLF